MKFGSHHYRYCGRPNAPSCDIESPELVSDSSQNGVRCVSDQEKAHWTTGYKYPKCLDHGFDIWWESDVWEGGCQTLDYHGAVALCAENDARLPTLDEVKDGCVSGSGCTLDSDPIWTSAGNYFGPRKQDKMICSFVTNRA